MSSPSRTQARPGDADLIAQLASVGADVTAFIGTNKLFCCPQCSHQRRKKAERCLSVRSDVDGFVFNCHHCGWSGGSRRIARAAMRSMPPRRSDQGTAAAASRVWREAVDPRGTPVEHYLLTERKLTLPDEIAGLVIRYHPRLYYEGQRVRGMVSLLRDIHDDAPCGIIRTFLDDQGRKIKSGNLGCAKGAAVKLDADAHVAEGLHVCEGVETGISAMAAGYRPVWALGGAGNIGKFQVLNGIEALTILTERNDNDKNAEAVAEVSARWHEAGREVFTVEMLVGDDLNDAWREVAP